MSTAPSLNYASRGVSAPRIRLMVAALIMLLYPLAFLSGRYIVEPLLDRHPYLYISGWYRYLPVIFAVFSTAAVVVGTWLLTTGQRPAPGEPSAGRLRQVVRAAVILCLMVFLANIIINLTNTEARDSWTYGCLASCVRGGTYVLLFIVTAFWMARLGRQYHALWIAIFSACALAFSAFSYAVSIAANIAYFLLVPPIPAYASAYELLTAYTHVEPPLVQLLSAVNRVVTPTHLVVQAALWIAIALWAGMRRNRTY